MFSLVPFLITEKLKFQIPLVELDWLGKVRQHGKGNIVNYSFVCVFWIDTIHALLKRKALSRQFFYDVLLVCSTITEHFGTFMRLECYCSNLHIFYTLGMKFKWKHMGYCIYYKPNEIFLLFLQTLCFCFRHWNNYFNYRLFASLWSSGANNRIYSWKK